MNRHINAIVGRLSLRPPQRESLEILDRVTELLPLQGEMDIATALEIIRSEFPDVTDFEREFPSLCFALATGVGKTRLMGAFITYLHLAHGINNFFILAPNLTIYNKLITDFTPNTSKYVFKGIAEFAISPPELITGETYENRVGTLFDNLIRCKINVFNISKINSEVRGGRAPRIRQLSEYIGQSYFDYLSKLPDLVLLMDESHRYRASAGIRAINELRPILGLELTATPFVEGTRGAVPFKNVIFDYPLARAMEHGFVKEPAVVTRRDFSPAGMTQDEIELIKLEDGIRLHEAIKVDLETYARETNNNIVKPFVLVIARDTTHAGQLLQRIQSDGFFEGRYKEKVIQVDSSVKEEEVIERLLRVEDSKEPTEIVIHVNMLKEGWDVTNLYTIVPLRAANARILIEQSIGRGLRLPYGKRTGVSAVDRLNIVAHDRFQEIIDEARRPDSIIQLKELILENDQSNGRAVTVVSQPNVANQLGLRPTQITTSTVVAGQDEKPAFSTPNEQRIAQITYDVIRNLENRPEKVPTLDYLHYPEVQSAIVSMVEERSAPTQLELALEERNNTEIIADIVSRTVNIVTQQTISIPRVLVVPQGNVQTGFHPFTLELHTLRYQPIADDLWIQHLKDGRSHIVSLTSRNVDESRLEDYIVRGLIDFDDISYDLHADLLYDLAEQAVQHFLTYLSEDDTRKVLRVHQRQIAQYIHAQMLDHYWEETTGYEVKISKGYSELKPCAYTTYANEARLDFRVAPTDKSNMAKYLFEGFQRCLYHVQKFHSDSERILAVVLDRESIKWFRPVKGQFQIYYKQGADPTEYQPDFVAETESMIYMLEPKKRSEMEAADVLAKKEAAEKWCNHASGYTTQYGGKRWRYVLIPHDVISENKTIAGLALEYGSEVVSNV